MHLSHTYIQQEPHFYMSKEKAHFQMLILS